MGRLLRPLRAARPRRRSARCRARRRVVRYGHRGRAGRGGCAGCAGVEAPVAASPPARRGRRRVAGAGDARTGPARACRTGRHAQGRRRAGQCEIGDLRRPGERRRLPRPRRGDGDAPRPARGRGETVDAIVWPENSAEFALPDQPYRELALRELSERADAPIVVGTVLRDPDDTFTNSTLVYDEAGGTGVRYDKRRPVPFAEYMPNREFFRALVPDLVDLVRLDYRAGTRSAVLEIDGAGGSFAAGIAICFDIIFDDHAVALMGRGPTGGGVESQVIFAQTNNADFGRTDESAQQLAIARLRAVETGRALVNISTVGTSAIVLPDGADVDRLTPFTRDAMVAEVPLSTGETPALRYGPVVAAAWMLLGAAGVIAGVIVGAIRGPIDGSVFRRRNAAQRETD
ncbi:apolipoprotein N-acyltransferase [Leucobacter soli]|uniref:apolipoprotein N-acyltransferase n=1 Tax=Leucobacter soli TaxID=2812850 RepID=UPI003606CF06